MEMMPPRYRATRIALGIGVGVLLHVVAGWWSPTALAQATNITTTNSTTTHTTYTEVSAPAPCPLPLGVLNLTETSVTTQTSFGPATILIGPEQSQTFFVAAGTMNINTNVHTQFFIDCVAAVPVMPPAALGGTTLIAVGLGVWAISRRRRTPSGPPRATQDREEST
jgi:hypothetical protein